MQTLLLALGFAFISNFVWEHIHAQFYTHPSHEAMTELHLFMATLGDVGILAGFVAVWYFFAIFRRNLWLVIPLALLVAVVIEKYALATERWAYTSNMPLVPYLEVGVSPLLQLVVTGFGVLLIVRSFNQKRR